MPYQQHTHCLSKSDYDSFWNFGGRAQGPIIPLLSWAILQAMKDALIGAFVGFLAGGPLGAGIGAGIGFSYGYVDGFCDAWLNRRLICINKDVCALGKVAWQEAPAHKEEIERLFDNDASFNLRLIPYDGSEFARTDRNPVRNAAQIAADGFPAADLLRRAFGDLDYKGYGGDDYSSGAYPDHPGGRWTLHCEFEGNAMVTLRDIAKALAVVGPISWPLGIIAGAVYGAYYGATESARKAFKTCKKGCKIPILCDIVCAVAAFFAGVAGLVAGFVAGFVLGIFLGPIAVGAVIGDWVNSDGSFADAANDPQSGTIEDEDCVIVLGDHVFDSGHSDGWHEIHPVKHLQKICTAAQPDDVGCCPHRLSANFADPAFKSTVQTYWDSWCHQIKMGSDPAVIETQGAPENQWCLHPLIDGCAPEEGSSGLH